jgi:hypothetical protein
MLAALLPGWSVENPNQAVGVQFQAGDYLSPHDDPVHLALYGRRQLPETRRVIPASGQDRPAVRAEGYGTNGAFMAQRCAEGLARRR